LCKLIPGLLILYIVVMTPPKGEWTISSAYCKIQYGV
jgi:hypothetical protein